MLSLLSPRPLAPAPARPVLTPTSSRHATADEPQAPWPGHAWAAAPGAAAFGDARPLAMPCDEPAWHDLWWRAGSGHAGPWGLQVRALQADHSGLAQALSAWPLAGLVAYNTAGQLRASAQATPRLVPHGQAAWAWAFAWEQPAHPEGWQRQVCFFDRGRQPMLRLQLEGHQDPHAFYQLAERFGSLALRPKGHEANGDRAPLAQPATGAHRLAAPALPDLLTRAAQAGLALELHLHLAGVDVQLPLRPQGLQAGHHHLRLDALGCVWQLRESALDTVWWLPARTAGHSPWLQVRDGAGHPLASLGAAPRAAGRRPCGWQTLMADALNEG